MASNSSGSKISNSTVSSSTVSPSTIAPSYISQSTIAPSVIAPSTVNGVNIPGYTVPGQTIPAQTVAGFNLPGSTVGGYSIPGGNVGNINPGVMNLPTSNGVGGSQLSSGPGVAGQSAPASAANNAIVPRGATSGISVDQAGNYGQIAKYRQSLVGNNGAINQTAYGNPLTKGNPASPISAGYNSLSGISY